MSGYAEVTMRSTVLDMDVKLELILPEDRHVSADLRGTTYPILYILHGYKEDCSTWMHLSNLPLLVRDLPLIVCTVSGYNGFYVNQKSGFRIFDYLTQELPMKLKNFLPISDGRENTYIMGESMGGYGTLRLALGAPEVYGHACVLSGGPMAYSRKMPDGRAQNRIEMLLGSEEEFKGSDNDLYALADRLEQSDGPKPKLVFYCGTEDPGYERNRAYVEYLEQNCPSLGVKAEYWHGAHDFYFWNTALPKALHEFGFDTSKYDAAI